jgi:hypothetical protein
VEGDVLLDEDDQTVLDLAAVEVRGLGEGAERLAAVAGEDGEDALGGGVSKGYLIRSGARKSISIPRRVLHTGPRLGTHIRRPAPA